MSLKSFFASEKSKNIYFEKIGSGKTALIFLHGLAGSRRQWDKTYYNLSQKYTLYFIDLLGFGYSAKPRRKYNLDTHVSALRQFIIEEVREKSKILIGHSLGAIVSLGYLSKYPNELEAIILFSLPLYSSTKEAMEIIQKYSKPKYFVVDSLYTRIACTIWCYYGGSITRNVMPYFYRKIPKEMASDGLLHTYDSYMSTLYEVIYNQNLNTLLTNKIAKKIFLIHGENDEVAPLRNIQKLSKKYNLHLDILKKEGHGFPNEAKEKTYKSLNSLIQFVAKD